MDEVGDVLNTEDMPSEEVEVVAEEVVPAEELTAERLQMPLSGIPLDTVHEEGAASARSGASVLFDE